MNVTKTGDEMKLQDKRMISICCKATAKWTASSGGWTGWFVCEKCKEPCSAKSDSGDRGADDPEGRRHSTGFTE